jgi:hypothetical protein
VAAPVAARLNPHEGRRFAFTVGAAFLVLAGLMHWRGSAGLSVGFAMLGGSLLVGGLLIPGRLGPVFRAWMGLGQAISRLTTPIFMSLVFFLAILPIGLATRAVGYKPLVHRRRGNGYWIERSANARHSDLRRQF